MKRASHARGFLLLTGLAVTAGILTLVAVSMTRAITNFNSASISLQRAQALQFADAGIEAAILEEQGRLWSWTTHSVDGKQVKYDGQPWLFQGADLDKGTNEYLLPATAMMGQQVRVRVTPGPSPTWYWVQATNRLSGSPATQTITALVRPILPSDYAVFTDGPVWMNLDHGQGVISYDGTIYIDGYLRFTVPSGVMNLTELAINQLMVYGEIYETTTAGNVLGVRVHTSPFKPPFPPAPGNFIPWSGAVLPPVNKTFRSVVRPGWNPADPTQPTPLDPPTAPNPAWISQFVNNPGNAWNQNLTGRIKEYFTGALPPEQMLPNVGDIDTVVQQFGNIADRVITSPNSPGLCGSGKDVSFANAMTLKIVQVIEIDVQKLNDCLNAPAVLYVKAPVRLINGQTVANNLTIVSPDAIYVKGDFNTVSRKQAAIVTGNRSYFLSPAFKDFSQFVSQDPQVINTWTDPGATAYNNFKANYDVTTTLPPRPEWLGISPGFNQNLMVIAPVQRSPDDRLMNLKHNYLESGPTDGWSQPVHLFGSFVELKDPNPALATNYTNWPYTDTSNSTPVPQDDWIQGQSVNDQNIFQAPYSFNTVEDPALTTNPPPGLLKVRPWAGKVMYWREQ